MLREENKGFYFVTGVRHCHFEDYITQNVLDVIDTVYILPLVQMNNPNT